MSKRFLLILLAIVVLFGGVFLISSKKDSSSNTQPTNHVFGQGSKHVTLIEYGDYQCPVCGAYYPIVKQVTDKYQVDIFFQFRNLPLSQIHQNAFGGARAAEAAGLQGKYFEMHDLLYESQSTWADNSNPTSLFEAMAQQLGLNIDQFRKDFASSQVNNLIQADLAAFNKTKNEVATPTFFLDGQKIANESLIDSAKQQPTLEKFSALIDAEIAKKNP